MSFPFNKLFSLIIFNTSLFLILFMAIQNSNKKAKVNFIIDNTVNLPISFIIGGSFITGSITGSFISFDFLKKNKSS